MKKFVLFVICLALAGCPNQRPKEERNPAPSSNLTKLEAVEMAYRARADNPFMKVTTVQPTGSMVPYLDSRTVLLLEVYTGQPLFIGDIVVFNRGDKPNVLHKVEDVKGDAFFAAGVNNQGSDGWFPRTAISYRCIALFYSQRQ